MTMQVDITNPASVRAAIRALKRYKKEIAEGQGKALLAIANDVGKPVAEGMFRDAIDSSDHPEDWQMPTVTVEKTENGVKLAARGEDVGFLELGTGFFNPAYPIPGFPEHGTYGKGKGMQTSWYYTGENGSVRTHGIEPAEAMLTAAQEMTAYAAEKVREALEK